MKKISGKFRVIGVFFCAAAVAGSLSLFSSCTGSGSSSSVSSSALLVIDGQPVPEGGYSSAESRQEVYRILCALYDARRSQAELYAASTLLGAEARSQSLSLDSFLTAYTAARITPARIRQTVEEHVVGQFIDDGTGRYVPTASAQGQTALRLLAEADVREALTDSLFRAHGVELNIAVPAGPRVSLDSVDVFRLWGPDDAPTRVVLCLDPLCTGCRTTYRGVARMVAAGEMQGVRIDAALCCDDVPDPENFAAHALENVSQDVLDSPLEAVAVAAAARVGAGAEMLRAVMTYPGRMQPDVLVREANSLGVEPAFWAHDEAVADVCRRLEEQHLRLAERGAASTPTVLLDGRRLWRGEEAGVLRSQLRMKGK